MNTDFHIIPRLRAMGWLGADEEASVCSKAINAVMANFLTSHPECSLEHPERIRELNELKLIRGYIERDRHDYVEAYGLLRGFEHLAEFGYPALTSKSWKSLNIFKTYGVPIPSPLPNLYFLDFESDGKFDIAKTKRILNIYPSTIIETIINAAAHFCRDSSQAEFIALMIQSTPNINRFNSIFLTHLHIAVTVNNIMMARLLLQYGANPNAQTARREKTPIAHALTPEMINLLLENGANPSLPYTDRGTDYPHGVPLNSPFRALIREKTAMKRLT